MFESIRNIRRALNAERSMILISEDGHSPARKYTFTPKLVLTGIAAAAGAVMLITVALLFFTPLRTFIPGYGTEEIRQTARLNNIRMAAIQDSLSMQQIYVDHLRKMLYGDVEPGASASETNFTTDETLRQAAPQPILTQADTPVENVFPEISGSGQRLQGAIDFPALSPVEGFLTQPFDESKGHYGVDFAVAQGTPVKSIAPGRVIFSDWTHDGGYAIAVQHLDGYISVYMHNKLLSKDVGDRVGARETIAVSGNTGEVTTGPHLHFELWQDGRPLDPKSFFANWQEPNN